MAFQDFEIQGHFLGDPFSAEILFRDLSPNARQSLSAITSIRRIPEQHRIIKEGREPDIHVLIEGKADIIIFNRLNDRKIRRKAQKNEIIGLTETIAGQPFRLTVRTLTPCRFEFIEKADFNRFLEDHPEVCFRVLKLLGWNLNKSFQTFASMIF
ncbi:MAG: cyclic nucleotide-binding domain-containing protein [Pyrinomonadaceae bacterium]